MLIYWLNVSFQSMSRGAWGFNKVRMAAFCSWQKSLQELSQTWIHIWLNYCGLRTGQLSCLLQRSCHDLRVNWGWTLKKKSTRSWHWGSSSASQPLSRQGLSSQVPHWWRKVFWTLVTNFMQDAMLVSLSISCSYLCEVLTSLSWAVEPVGRLVCDTYSYLFSTGHHAVWPVSSISHHLSIKVVTWKEITDDLLIASLMEVFWTGVCIALFCCYYCFFISWLILRTFPGVYMCTVTTCGKSSTHWDTVIQRTSYTATYDRTICCWPTARTRRRWKSAALVVLPNSTRWETFLKVVMICVCCWHMVVWLVTMVYW